MKKYKKNDIVIANVSKVEKYGAFVLIDDVYTGLIHVSEINGKYINDISKYFHKGKKLYENS